MFELDGTPISTGLALAIMALLLIAIVAAVVAIIVRRKPSSERVAPE